MTADILTLAHAALEDDELRRACPECDGTGSCWGAIQGDYGCDHCSAARENAAARTREPALAREVIRLSEAVTAADERLLAVLDGTFSVGDGTAQREIERLRAELERMRPVFEAAKAWRREISKPGAYGRVGDTRLALEESIDAYDHAFHADGVVDMHGIALKATADSPWAVNRTLLLGYEQRVEQLEREIEAVKPVVRAAREVVLGHRELGCDLAELVEALSRVRLWKVD